VHGILVRVAAEQVQSALPSWIRTFLDTDARARGSLTETLRAYADADADMNVLKAAKALSIHPNTIYARMQKIENLTAAIR
jgi:DNA-binding PucR family transcriptional regulator